MCAVVKSFTEYFPVTFFMNMYECEHVHVSVCAQMPVCIGGQKATLGVAPHEPVPLVFLRKGLLLARVHHFG